MRPSWLIRRNKGEETSKSQALSWHKGGPGENKGVESDQVLSAWEERTNNKGKFFDENKNVI